MFYPNNVRRYQANKQPEFYTTSFISIPSLYCNSRLIDSSLRQKCYSARKKQMLRLSKMTWSRIVLMAMTISLFLSVQSSTNLPTLYISESQKSYQYDKTTQPLYTRAHIEVNKGFQLSTDSTQNHKQVAIKRMTSEKFEQSEIEIMKALQGNEYILELIDSLPAAKNETYSYIITELCERDVLAYYLKQKTMANNYNELPRDQKMKVKKIIKEIKKRANIKRA
jgi:hypothetical protein